MIPLQPRSDGYSRKIRMEYLKIRVTHGKIPMLFEKSYTLYHNSVEYGRIARKTYPHRNLSLSLSLSRKGWIKSSYLCTKISYILARVPFISVPANPIFLNPSDGAYPYISICSSKLALQWETKIVEARKSSKKREKLTRESIRSVTIDYDPYFLSFPSSPLLSLLFNSPLLTFNAWRFPLLHRPLHSRYIFYCQYQRRPGVGPGTHGILYFVTLMARLDTILHSGNDRCPPRHRSMKFH